MNTQSRKKWIVLIMLFLFASVAFPAKGKTENSKQSSSRASKPTAHASMQSSERQAKPMPTKSSASRNNQTAQHSQPTSKPMPSRASSQSINNTRSSRLQRSSTSPASNSAAKESSATRSSGQSRTIRPYVKVDNSRSQSRMVSSGSARVNSAPTKTTSSEENRSVTVIKPGKSQISQRNTDAPTREIAKSEKAEKNQVVTRIESTGLRSLQRSEIEETTVTTKPVSAGISTGTDQSASRGSLSKPISRGWDFGKIAIEKQASTTDKKPLSDELSSKTSVVKPIRITRDEISTKTDKVSTDQIRSNRLSENKDQNQAAKSDRASTRERVAKPIERTSKPKDQVQTIKQPKSADAEKTNIRQRVVKPIDRSVVRDSRQADESPTRRGGDRRDSRRDEPVIQSKAASGKERLAGSPKPTPSAIASSRRIARVEDYDSRIVINGDNNVIVQGDVTRHRPRPYIPRRLYGDRHHFHRHSGWRDCGSYFSLTFSLNSCGRIAYVPYYGYYGFTYYYPSYHRRYIFVSLGGWWPYHYRYRRYYWYGCHPYYWYGPTVIREYPAVNEYNTYNTYNYYGSNAVTTTTDAWRYPFGDESYDASDYINRISPVDEPEFETAADLCFAKAVDLFTAGKYEDAAAQFREAIRISPDDIILPFTYSQALFAGGDYALSAAVLRGALASIPENELTIYYPRGLYEKEEILLAQIAGLKKAAEAEPFAGGYHLLLGYQYLGLGELEKAAKPLAKAAADPANEQAAGMLLALAARLEEEAAAEK